MADILLTHANHLYSDWKQLRKMQPYPPPQTLVAAALLWRKGFDCWLMRFNRDEEQNLRPETGRIP